MNHTILLTFDVEDWFQVENFKQCIPFSSWASCELRVEKNVHKILDLLDSINSPHVSNSPPCAMPALRKVSVGGRSAPCDLSSPPSSPNASRLTPHVSNSPPCAMRSAPCEPLRATFFILGWIAERLPHLVREIQARGHEIASHGYSHELCKEQSVECLKEDLARSKRLLEDITGTHVYGYRAPSFSIDQNILSLIEGAGYLYDSSFNSFKLNKRYGQVEFGTNNGSNGLSIQMSDRFYELPISNLKIGRQFFPWGGGGYFRLIPLQLFKHGVQSILKKHGAYLFYMHPWEVDPDQPKVIEAPPLYRFRHYVNLEKTLNKLSYFLEELKDCRFQTCYEYLMDKNRITSLTH